MRSEGKVICQPARPYPSHSSPASHPCHPVPPWPSCCLRPVLFTQIICFGIEPRISRLARTKKAYFPSVKSLKSVVTMLSIRVPSKSPPIAGQIRPPLLHSNTPRSHPSAGSPPAFPTNYFHFCKSAFLGAKPLLPGLYKAFLAVNNPVFGHAFCTHGGQSFFQIHALMVP